MRDAFVRALMREAAADPRIVLVTGDLGFGVLRPFWETYPDQFINAGIAEQSMVSMAAGLSMTGRTVLVYSIGNFPTLRALEQIRNDCAYHEANVKIVCVGGGFVYGPLGMSHHATEDMGVLRTLPGVTVFTPGDPVEAEAVVPVMLHTPGCCYLRLSRAGEPVSHTDALEDWKLPQALTLRKGRDIALLSAGGILSQTMAAADLLHEKGVEAEVVSFPCLKPLDAEKVCEMGKRFPWLITVEEHTVIGALGSAVCEIVAEEGLGCRVHRMGMPYRYSTLVGSQQYLRKAYGFDAQAVCDTALRLLRG